MIVGSGLLAKAFMPLFENDNDVCIYAAGVSNSTCMDEYEFARERARLTRSLTSQTQKRKFVYFSTCSIYDRDMKDTAYVRHKQAMELLVSGSSNYLIVRLPQVAGETPNPHTLLNYLYARIVRSERFNLWSKAKRNIIDVDDVVSITAVLINDPLMCNMTVNVANPQNYTILLIVNAFERSLNKSANYVLVDKGSEYAIDVSLMQSVVDKSGAVFDDSYLEKIISKYYENK